MAAYILLGQLAEKPGAAELAQVTAQIGTMPVEAQTLDAVLRGEDMADFDPFEVDKALAAVKRIDEAVKDAELLIDGYLRQRGYKLPFERVPRLLAVWTRAIARYYLHQHLITDEKGPILRDYKDALKLLMLVAEGKFSLGLEDELAQTAGLAKFNAPPRVFTQQTLKDY